jgi:hypothetical protein
MTGEKLDPSRCAICGEPNECGMARGDSECWCFNTTIPKSVLDLVPEQAQNVVCVCATCAAKGAKDEAETGRA